MAGTKQQKYAAFDTILDQYNEGLITVDDVLGQYIVITMRFEPICECAQCKVIRAKERVDQSRLNHPSRRAQ